MGLHPIDVSFHPPFTIPFYNHDGGTPKMLFRGTVVLVLPSYSSLILGIYIISPKVYYCTTYKA